MIVEHTTDGQWETNTYLLADRPGGHGVLVDPNGEIEPLLRSARQKDIRLTHIVVTHEHEDHMVGVADVAADMRVQVAAHPAAAAELSCVDVELCHGEVLSSGSTDWRILALPGHAIGQVGLHTAGLCVTADALFAGAVGGQREPAQRAFAEVKTSVGMILALESSTVLLPGHGAATTVGDECRSNPFVRVWRGDDPEADLRCRVGGPYGWEARLILQAPDYDGGTKAWVRFPGAGDCILPGSLVETLTEAHHPVALGASRP